jgi:hypothetical protein
MSHILPCHLLNRCVCVWDTIGSVFNAINALHIKDTSLPASINIALHALSLQEDRQVFLLMLWTVPKNGLGGNQILKQVGHCLSDHV